MKFKIFSILLLVTFITGAQQNEQEIAAGKRFIFKSDILNEERPVLIHLPNGYEQSNISYPVMYLLDGDAHFLHTSGIVSYLSGIGRVPQMIIVAIPNVNRNRDFSPTKTEIPNSGGAANFTLFLEEELIPFIDKNYRTESFRIIFGHSLTAMYSLHTFITQPDLFDAYIAASPYVMYDEGFLIKTAEKIPDLYNKNKFVYYNIGNEPEYFELLDELTGIFEEKSSEKIVWKYEKFPTDDHGSIPPKTIQAGLSFIYNDWQLPENFAETGTLERLTDYYEKLDSKYGYEIDIPEAQVNLLAYRMMFAGRNDAAVELFKYNVELFPESANVYDSLGEGLEAVNKLEEAKENYETAVRIGEKNNDPNLHFFKEHLENIQKKLAVN